MANLLLFYTHDLRQVIETQGRALDKEIDSLTENEVLNTSEEDMVEYLTGKYRIHPLIIGETGVRADISSSRFLLIDPSRPITTSTPVENTHRQTRV